MATLSNNSWLTWCPKCQKNAEHHWLKVNSGYWLQCVECGHKNFVPVEDL